MSSSAENNSRISSEQHNLLFPVFVVGAVNVARADTTLKTCNSFDSEPPAWLGLIHLFN